MKTLTYSITLFLFFSISFNGYSQNASKIKPVKIYWIADGKIINIERAQKGIATPGNLSLAIVLNNDVVHQFDGQKLEFKWYKRGSTRDYLTNSFEKQISKQAAIRNGYTIKTSRSNLKKGWWKVKVEAYIDRKLLSYQNKQEFWINLF